MPKKPRIPYPTPIEKIEVSEPPRAGAEGLMPDRWVKFGRLLEQVRALDGRSAKICHHPAREVVQMFKIRFPGFKFVSRAIVVGEKETFGIWARLDVPGGIPDLPSQNGLHAPDLG